MMFICTWDSLRPTRDGRRSHHRNIAQTDASRGMWRGVVWPSTLLRDVSRSSHGPSRPSTPLLHTRAWDVLSYLWPGTEKHMDRRRAVHSSVFPKGCDESTLRPFELCPFDGCGWHAWSSTPCAKTFAHCASVEDNGMREG